MVEDMVKKFTNIEEALNKNLFWIAVIVTVLTMVMLVTEFFSRGEYSSVSMMTLFYMAVLILYSFHKETLRWMHRKGEERQGEKFVYAWLALTIVLYIVNFASNCYFDFAPDGTRLDTLEEITVTTLEVFAVFIITRASKMKKITEMRKGGIQNNGR